VGPQQVFHLSVSAVFRRDHFDIKMITLNLMLFAWHTAAAAPSSTIGVTQQVAAGKQASATADML
jgi:hypothetical protein